MCRSRSTSPSAGGARLQALLSLGAIGPEHVAVQSIERLCLDALGLLPRILAEQPWRYDNLLRLRAHTARSWRGGSRSPAALAFRREA
jgi:hypothetical protein